jgi:hypothetical protein
MRTRVVEACGSRRPWWPCRPTASNRLPRRSLLLGGLAAGVATLLAAGCASQRRTGAKKLLEAIAKANRRQSIARKKFTDIVSSRLQESSATTDDDVAAGLEKLKAETRTIREESEAWPVPKATEADSLILVCQRVFKARAQLFDDFSTPFLETLRNPVLLLPQKRQKAGKMFESMTGVDDALTLDLRRAQRTYAGAMGVFSYE